MRRTTALVLFYIILMTLMTLIILTTLTACSSDGADKTAVPAIEYEKQPVQAFGVVKALNAIELTAPFGLKTSEILVKEGQSISAGDILAEFDITEVESQLSLMRQELAAAKEKTAGRAAILAEKRKLINSNRDPELLKLEKSLDAAKLKKLAAAEEAERLEVLNNIGTVTEKEAHDSSMAAEASRLAVEELELSLESLKSSKQMEFRLEDLQINIEEADNRLLEKKIGLMEDKLRRENFKDNKILSPVSKGIITGIFCKKGADAPEKSLLFSIVDTDALIVEANVDEQFIQEVRLGARAYIIPESDRSMEIKGNVTFISSMAVLLNGETVITVQVTLEDRDIGLLPGSNAQVDILTE